MNIYEQLVADGWREYPNQFKVYSRCFYKQFETPTRCHGNYDKAGCQVELSVSTHHEHIMVELELTGGLKDESWMKLSNYCVPNDLLDIKKLIPRLLHIWEAANSFPKALELVEPAS